MEINTLTKSKLLPVLQKFNFAVKEEFKNIIRFESPKVKINIAFNERDRSNLVEIGLPVGPLFPLNDDAVKSIFKYSLPVDNVKPEVFIENLCTLFKTHQGVEILNGDIAMLRKVIELQSKKYTIDLVNKSLFKQADKAWETEDYANFIMIIDQITGQISKSYEMKYKISKNKIR